MAAYLIGHITVKDPERWKKYVAGVGRSLPPYGGELLFRGKKNSVLAGKHPHELMVAIRFPDQSNLQSWFRSGTYQALIPLRDQAADVVIVAYDS